jgi:hypothetical protein
MEQILDSGPWLLVARSWPLVTGGLVAIAT